MFGVRLTFFMAAVEVLCLLPLASVAALVPTFIAAWQLSSAEAGWITGIYYLGYMVAVPFFMALTNRDAPLVRRSAS